MLTVFLHRAGRTEIATAVDPRWLEPGSAAVVWVDLARPTAEEAAVLRDVFHFHELAIEDALSTVHHPKVESYDGYLYLILHGIAFERERHTFGTHDTDFFLGPNYLVTVHPGTSRSIAQLQEMCRRHEHILAEGPVALLHRIVDLMVEHYRPEVEALQQQLDDIESCIFEQVDLDPVRQILAMKRDLAALRRVTIPQRDAVGRLARREFAIISTEMAYRFRDVHDQLVRLADETMLMQDRVTGILDAHLSSVSNRLNQVMRRLTVIATVFGAWTVLTGIFGMNVPPFGMQGSTAGLWAILATLAGVGLAMIALFKHKGWM